MKATVRHVRNHTMLASSGSGHFAIMDTNYHGNISSAPSPLEMLIMAAGSCTAVDIVDILGKMRIDFSDLTVEMNAVRGEGERSRIIEKMHFHYTLRGDVPEDKLKKAIELSMEKYCTVSLNVKTPKEYTYEIKP